MLQVDLPLSYALGGALAVAARRHLENEPSVAHNPWLTSTMHYLGFVHVPACLTYLAAWTDWDVMYWWSRETLPAWVAPMFALGLFFFGWLGFVATHALLRRRQVVASFALIALCLAWTGAVCAIWHDRFLFVGTQAEFRAAPAANLLKSDLLWGLLFLNGVVMGLPLAWLFWKFSRRPPPGA